MRFDIEDEIDYGDSPLEAPTPPTELFLEHPTVSAIEEPQYDDGGAAALSSPEHVIPEYLRDLLDGRPNRSTFRASDTSATRPKQQRLTPETLTDFALYQANQKVYEAMFLKAFTAHALHPDTFRVDNDSDGNTAMMEKITEYLRAVAENVNQIIDKMIWNAHAKTVNFFVDEERRSVPFINTECFKQGLFQGVDLENTSSVVMKMNQSWHRVYTQSRMVQYTAEDYPLIGSAKERSPFNELREATRTVLFTSSTDTLLPKGRVFTLPTKVGNRTVDGSHNYPGTLPTQSRGHSTAASHHSNNANSSLPNRDGVANAKRVSTTSGLVGKENESTTRSSLNQASSARRRALETIHDFSDVYPHSNLAHLKAYVSHPDQNEQILDDRVDQDESQMELPVAVNTGWRTKLLRDHKIRLEKKRLRSRPALALPTDYDYVVLRAEMQGILKPATAESRAMMRAHGQKMRELARVSNTRSGRIEAIIRQRHKPTEVTGSVSKSTLHQLHRKPYTRKSRKEEQGPATRTAKAAQPSRKRKATPLSGPPTKRPRKASNVRDKAKVVKDKACKVPRAKSNNKRMSGELVLERPAISLGDHPSGSRTLESDQVLPEGAYFEKVNLDEKLAWRCGIKHACGHYYNAGDRKSCVGCGTNIRDNANSKSMDFYLPSMQWFRQPAQDIIWKPSKQFKILKKAPLNSHNSIAKVRYWEAINAGASPAEARQKGIEAIEEHLRPKPKREPTPKPTPTPTPEPVDLGPHPSGSKTMEHGQGIPECAYFEKTERHEEFAWRCDGGHAFGRYYMAYDKRTCPGCGLGVCTTSGKRTTMDFYMPSGTVVRQEARGIANWSPRALYRSKKSAAKGQPFTHNQIVTRKYWDAKAQSEDSDQALELALKETDAELDAKAAVAAAKTAPKCESETGSVKDGDDDESSESDNPDQEGGVILSLAPRDSSGGVTPGQVIYRRAEVIDDTDDGSDVLSSSSDSE